MRVHVHVLMEYAHDVDTVLRAAIENDVRACPVLPVPGTYIVGRYSYTVAIG